MRIRTSGYHRSSQPQRLTTHAIDCSHLNTVSVRFRRWLAVEGNDFDYARLSVSLDSIHWLPVLQNPVETMTDSSWTEMTYDLSAIADYRKALFLRWEMGPTDSSVEYGGWPLDDIEILGVLDPFPPSRAADQYIVF